MGIKLTEIKVSVFGKWQTMVVADTGQYREALAEMNRELDDFLREYSAFIRSWNPQAM